MLLPAVSLPPSDINIIIYPIYHLRGPFLSLHHVAHEMLFFCFVWFFLLLQSLVLLLRWGNSLKFLMFISQGIRSTHSVVFFCFFFFFLIDKWGEKSLQSKVSGSVRKILFGCCSERFISFFFCVCLSTFLPNTKKRYMNDVWRSHGWMTTRKKKKKYEW